MKIKALKGKVIVSEIDGGEKQYGSIVLLDDNGKSEGIHPRWTKVFSVGEGVTEIKEGQWILVEHGRWTRPMRIKDDAGVEHAYWGIDWPNGAIAVSDEKPDDIIFSEFSSAEFKTR